MGLDTVIVAGILIIAAMAASYVVAGGMNTVMRTTSETFKTMQEDNFDKMNTRIQIEDVVYINGSFYLRVSNAGSTKIRDVDKMDILVYDGKDTEWVPHIQQKGGMGWVVEEIENDSLNPGIFDPGEVMNIKVDLDYYIPYNSDTWIKIIAPNGAESTKYFSGGWYS